MSQVKERAIVKYAYAPQYAESDEIALNIGDIVIITDRSNEADGWLAGECKGQEGVFPASYVEILKPSRGDNQPPPPPIDRSHSVQLSSLGETKTIPQQTTALAVAKAINVGETNLRQRQTLFGLYATYAAMMSSLFYAVTGLGLLCWGAYGFAPSPIYDNPRYYDILDAGIGFWALLTGFGIFLFELRYGAVRLAERKLSYRGIAYIIAIVPGCFALPTGIGASTLIIPTLLHFYASCKREYYIPPLPQKKTRNDDDLIAKMGCFDKFLRLVGGQNPDRQLSRIVFLTCYIAGNLAAGITHAMKAYDDIQAIKDWNEYNEQNPATPPLPSKPYHTYWLLPAKFFGNVMNFNYTFILLPVSHSLMRWLVNNSRHRAWYTYPFKAILWFFPIDDTLKIHKMVAWVAFSAAIGHTVAHVFNYVTKAQYVWDTFGAGIWVTGIGLILVIFTLYPATFPSIKRGHFEIFWATHLLYVVLIVMSVIHGKDMIGPNYWKWLIPPGTIYVIERLYREFVTRQPVNVMSVTFMSNSVMSLSIEKSGALNDYCEGQYAYISCPAISGLQWHPFTISSAPQEQFVSFHIRIQGKGSWTLSLCEYFRVLGSGSNKACLKLAHMEDGQLVPGLVNGPNGVPLLRIHGPYSAPTQHFTDYNHVLVSASGIGVTPLASALKSIVHYRWRFAIDRAFPDKAVFVWVVAHRELASFRWFVRTIHEAEAAVAHLRASSTGSKEDGKSDIHSRDLRIHIYVTSYSAAESEKFKRGLADEANTDDAALWGTSYYAESGLAKTKLSWSEMDLYTALMVPEEGTKQFGNTYVTKGRPDWDGIFNQIHTTTTEKAVGVTFCGNPGIGRSLKEQCLRYTLKDNKRTKYHLHKEVF